MGEKKICSIDVAMDEPMFNAVHGLAEADGISASELIRMLVSTMIEERAAYYSRLHSIFGQPRPVSKDGQPGSLPENKNKNRSDLPSK